MSSNNTNSDAIVNNPAPEILWGATEIGRAIGRSRNKTLRLLEDGLLKSPKKLGRLWVVERSALLRELGAL